MLNLIIDTNSLVSALVKDSAARKIIFEGSFAFHAPKHLLDELELHFKEISKKSGFDEKATQLLFHFLTSYIRFCPLEIFKSKMKETKMLVKDQNDVEFVALAIAIPNEEIWTADKHFESRKR
jgi:predicted nucleic acid-binding protein